MKNEERNMTIPLYKIKQIDKSIFKVNYFCQKFKLVFLILFNALVIFLSS